MSAPNWIKDILRGGLPAVLDYGDDQPNAQYDGQDGMYTRPEQSMPTDLTGRDNANPAQNFLGGGNAMQYVVIIGGLLAAVYLVKKL